jgi:cyclic di-GMP phosphodiesterase
MINTYGSKILIVDDEKRNRMLLTKLMVNENYHFQEANNGSQALTMINSFAPDLILLDAMMPGMDGFEVAMQLKSSDDTQGIPIIMITALDDQQSRERGLSVGIEEFLSKPIKANEVQIRVRNLLRLKLANDIMANHNKILDKEVKLRTSELESAFEDSIYMLMRAAEYRDDETGAHVKRISYYCKHLAKAIEMDDVFCDTIFLASPMHDIGKIGIPDSILLKPGGFEPGEWEVMKTHTTIGSKILSGENNSPYIQMGKDIVLYHHERWDGSGYPHGLKGEDIPLSARIMSICDIYDALRSDRPYKKAFDHQTAMNIIEHGDDRVKDEHFDPNIKMRFVKNNKVFENIFDSYNK